MMTKTKAFWVLQSIALGLALVLFTNIAHAEISFPTKLPKTERALSAIVKAVPGLDKSILSKFHATSNSASADIKIRGEAVTVIAFKRTGVSKVLLAIVPKDFKLSSFLPIPSRTPVDGVKFQDIALVVVPKAAAKNRISTVGLPLALSKALGHLGSRADFKAGLNMFGKADFSSSASIKKVLQAMGRNQYSIPISGVFSADILNHDLKTANSKLKEKLLLGLNLRLKLPKMTIPGMPKIVSVKSGRLMIVGKEIKGKRKIFAGVTGVLNVKIGSKKHDFNFGILAGDPGKTWKATITAESKDKTSLPFFKPLALTNMALVAKKSAGKWDVVVNAKAKLNNKNVNVAVSHDPKDGTSAVIKGKIKLADLLPSGASIPGITDIEFDDLKINKDFLQVTGKVKKLDTVIAVFKRRGKTYIAINNPRPIKISSLISPAKGTPLDDVSFQHMNYIWAPKGGAETGMELSALPPDIAYHAKQVVRKVDLKEGLNVIGRMVIEKNSKVGKLLSKVGAYKDHLNIKGMLSPKLFHAGATTQIKNEILDSLDFKLPLPKVRIPGIPKTVSFTKTQLEIKGTRDGNKAGIDVDVTGEMDVKLGSQTVAFDFDVDLKKQAGKPTQVSVNGHTEPGHKITINMLHRFTLDSMRFKMDKKKAGWQWQVSAKSKFGSGPIDVTYTKKPAQSAYLDIETKMTLAQITGHSNLPGLSDIQANSIKVHDKHWRIDLTVKGVESVVNLYKPQGSAKYWVGLSSGDFSPDKFIPGTSGTPLHDVTFKGLAFVYNPTGSPATVSQAKLPTDIQNALKHVTGDLSLKSGLNVFGHMDVHPTGKIAKLLKKVGVHDLSLPLNGGFSPKAFSKNISGAAIKNAILDNLDLNINLPTPHIAEVSKFLTFKNGKLKIKGKLPGGARGIYVGVSGDVEVKVKSQDVAFFVDVEYDRAQGGASSDLHISGHTDKPWNHPLGIKFLNLEELKLDIQKKKNTSGDSSFDINMTAKSDVGRHSKLDVTVVVHEKNGKVTDAFFELDGPLKLSDIPGVRDIPHSSHFTIYTIKASEHGIEAKTKFGGKKDLDIFLFTGSGWNLIIRQDNFAVSEIVPQLKNTPLKHVMLSEAAVVISKDGLSGPLSGFSIIAQDALKDIYGANAPNIDVESGLNLIAAFEHKKSKGGMSDAFSRLGLSQERVILTGGIGGLFGGPTKFDVKVNLSAHSGARKQPKWMKKKPGVEAVFSMIATETAGQFDVEIGIGADIIANIHGTKLIFDAKTALEFEDGKIDVKVVAKLKDKKGWKNPFGIPGFTLYEVGFDLGIAEDGAIHLGFDGEIRVSGDTFKIAADADLLPEALGAPQDIAFIGFADKVDMFFMEKIALAMVGGEFKLDLPHGILPTFTKVKFAFVTPGAQEPDLHITGEGFAMAGAMNWLDREVGKMDVSVSPTKGIQASGKIDDLNLGPLHLKNNDFKMDVGVKALPSLSVDADVEMLGITDKVHFKFGKQGIDIAAVTNFGDLFKFNIKADIAGKNLTSASSIKNADIFLDASLSSDPGAWLRNFGSEAVKKKFASFDGFAVKAQKKVDAAKRKVDGLQSQIAAMRAKVKAEKNAAEAKLRAQRAKKVDSLQNQINGLNGRINGYRGRKRSCNQERKICDRWSFHTGSCAHHVLGHCIWYHHSVSCSGHINVPNIPERVVCSANNLALDTEIAAADVEKAGVSAAKGTADAVLKGIEAGIEILPTDLDPRVAGLILLKKGADLALDATKEALKGVLAFAKVLEKGTNVFKNTPSLFVLSNSSIQGDLKKALKGEPVVLDMNVRIMGKTLEQRLAFSLTKPEFDAEQFGFIALGIAMDTVVKAAEDIKFIPSFLIDDVKKVYTDEKKRIDGIINAAVAANGITGKPGVNQTTRAIAAMKEKQAAKAEAAGRANQNALAEAEAAHKADYNKFCSVPGNNPRTKRPVFDPCFYLNQYPDLAKAFGADFNKAAQHWLTYGIAEGRQSSPAFSALAYVTRNSDLANVFTGTGGKIDFKAAVNHWVSNGSKEGRNPKALECGNSGGAKGVGKVIFDPCFYVNNYPDLKAAFGDDFGQAYVHWVNHGIKEGRQSSNEFAIADYIIRYPDLMSGYTASTGTNYPGAIDHWRIHGRKEGRNSTPFQACGSSGGVRELAGRIFDPCFYVNKYSDLKKSFGYNNSRALSHWVGAGLINGRQSSASFDINAYVVRYPDLENVFVNATSGAVDYIAAMGHWKKDGKREGRNPKSFAACGTAGGVTELAKAEFDPCYYLNYYPDLKEKLAGRLELATQHYYQQGRKEGNRGSAGFGISSYILRYPDLTKSFISLSAVDFAAAWGHWKKDGKKEGRNPAPLGACGTTGGIVSLAKAEFDPCFYLNAYADLKTAVGKNWGKAAQHWQQYGIHEGRRSSTGFSIRGYLMRYDDLRKSFVNVQAGTVDYGAVMNHWRKDGKREGRNPGPLNCTATGGAPGLEKNDFDPCFYLNKYADLKKKYDGGWVKAAQHWIQYGIKEGRQSNFGVDLPSYVMRYDDLRKTFVNVKAGTVDYAAALGHWNGDGKKEGRNAAPLNCTATGGAPGLGKNVFDPCFYLNKYNDLKKKFDGRSKWVKAAKHWNQYGIKEGRQSSAGFSIKAYLSRYPDLQRNFGTNNYAAALNHWYTNGKKEGRNSRP